MSDGENGPESGIFPSPPKNGVCRRAKSFSLCAPSAFCVKSFEASINTERGYDRDPIIQKYMIAYLKGKVLAVTAETAIIETNGIGYEVYCSGGAFSAVQSGIGKVELFTYLQVKEDGLTLFGFVSLAEKQIFLNLISVSGVGPKLAIGILNGMPADEVARCIAAADTKRLSRIKGLGKKTAEKIVLELHGKVSASELLAADGGDGAVFAAANPAQRASDPATEEAIGALTGLGFTRNESQNAVAKAKEKGAVSVEEMIRTALSSM